MINRVPLPFQLLIIISSVFLFGHYIPEPIIRACYTFTLLFKEILSTFLPIIVFSFVFAGITSFKKNAPLVLGLLLLCITLSNSFVALLSFFVTSATLPFITSQNQAILYTNGNVLEPFFNINFPIAIGSFSALLSALMLGIFVSFSPMPKLEHALLDLKKIVHIFLSKFLIPLLPAYALGFLLKIHHEGTFLPLFQQYGKAFIVIACMQIVYLPLMFFVAQGFSFHKAWKAIRNALPSYLTGFSTMSSTVTIPITLEGAEKNLGGHSALAELAIPIMANVHLLGDCISTPILALTTLVLYTGALPDFLTYFEFMTYFSLTMLAASGIPGGAIIVMLPILTSILGFTPEMISIITTLYLVQDPLGTAGNVMGDGALVIMVNKLLRRLRIIQ